MYCCGQCQGIEEVFSEEVVSKELEHYRRRGPRKTTRMLLEAIEDVGVDGLTLLDIGGGVGAIQHALLSDGVARATCVDASSAYLSATQSEAKRRGMEEQVAYHHGNFVDLAAEIYPADIVTLDRVICCYHDMEKLVGLSAARAKKVYGVVYPRDRWWAKLVIRLMNFFYRLQKSSYRSFIHPTEAVEAIIVHSGLKRRSYAQTLVWQVVVYTR